MITKEKTMEVLMFHEQWLQNPTTRQFINLLSNHEERLVASLADKSMELTTISDQQLRQIAVQLKTTRTIKQLAINAETFAAKL